MTRNALLGHHSVQFWYHNASFQHHNAPFYATVPNHAIQMCPHSYIVTSKCCHITSLWHHNVQYHLYNANCNAVVTVTSTCSVVTLYCIVTFQGSTMTLQCSISPSQGSAVPSLIHPHWCSAGTLSQYYCEHHTRNYVCWAARCQPRTLWTKGMWRQKNGMWLHMFLNIPLPVPALYEAPFIQLTFLRTGLGMVRIGMFLPSAELDSEQQNEDDHFQMLFSKSSSRTCQKDEKRPY